MHLKNTCLFRNEKKPLCCTWQKLVIFEWLGTKVQSWRVGPTPISVINYIYCLFAKQVTRIIFEIAATDHSCNQINCDIEIGGSRTAKR